MRVIKLTDADGYTRRDEPGETLWLPMGTRPPRLAGTGLCATGVYRAYRTPHIAAFMDCIHTCLLPGGRAWWAETPEIVTDDGVKIGCHELMLVEPAELPTISTAARVRAVIYCYRPSEVPAWNEWAERWLSGKDRTAEAATAEARAVARAARAAAWEAEDKWAAAQAAEWAARAAAEAAWATEAASRAARAAELPLDLDEIIQRAIADEDAMVQGQREEKECD